MPAEAPPRSTRNFRPVLVLACAAGLVTAGWLSGTSELAQQRFGASASAASLRPAPAGFAGMVEGVKPAVFGIRVRIADDETPAAMERFMRRHGPVEMPRGAREKRMVTSQGSGFFITADGYAVTNNHVVKGAKTADIRTDDNKTFTARVVGSDPASDLALLKVDGRNDFPHVRFADAPPRVGEWIITVGNPFGLGGTVTAGIVSARGRDMVRDSYEDLLQIDAPVNKGSSGGPTFDVNGHVVGVNTMIFSPTGGSIGIAFDIPADRVTAVVAQLKDKGSVTRGWLGVETQAVSAEIADTLGLAGPSGVLIADLTADGPAGRAGLVSGDLIETVDATRVNTPREFTRTIETQPPGHAVALGILRNGEHQIISATLAQSPAPSEPQADSAVAATTAAEPSNFGLTLMPAGLAGRGSGVLVGEIDPNGPVADRGLEVGDVILDVAQRAVTAPDEVYAALLAARNAGKRSVLVRVKSGDKTQFVALPLG